MNLKLMFFLFWMLGGIGIVVNPAFSRMVEDPRDDMFEEKCQTPLAFDKKFRTIDAVSQDLGTSNELPKDFRRPLLPLLAGKKLTLQTPYKGLPYGAPTTSSGNVKSKKAKMLVVRINPDDSPEGGDEDSGDGEDGNDPDSDEEDEEDPYLRVKILERKREARIQEERSYPHQTKKDPK